MLEFNENGLKVNFKTLVTGKENGLFSEENKYVIPIYQRPYNWNEEEIKKLIDNIIESYENNSKIMFLSTIQLTVNKKDNTYEIIDGQQRLTTLYLLLLALMKKNDDKTNIVFNLNIGEPNKIYFDEKNKIINLNEVVFDNENKDLAKNKYITNYQIIFDYINEICKEKEEKVFLTGIIDYVLKNIYFIVFEIDCEKHSTANIIKMFNTLNTTGMDLNVSDLFKINFAEICNKIDGSDVSENISYVNKIYDEITDNNLESKDLIKLYQDIICSYDEKSRVKKYENGLKLSTDMFFDVLFDPADDLKNNEGIKPILKISEFKKIAHLYIDAQTYYTKYKNDDTKYFSYRLLQCTRYWKFWTFPFIYSYYNGYQINGKDNEKLFENSLRITECLAKLLVGWSIKQDRIVSAIHTFVSNEVYNKINIQDEKKLIDLIVDKKNNNWGKDENETKEQFKNAIRFDLHNKWLICLLIEMLNVKNVKSNKELNIWKNLDDLIFNPKDKNGVENKKLKPDIEHIFAKKNFESWDKPYKNLAEGIGNIMFLEGSINKSIGDKTVNEKEKKYKNSNFSLAGFNHNRLEEWSNNELAKQEIDHRGDLLSKQIIDYVFS